MSFRVELSFKAFLVCLSACLPACLSTYSIIFPVKFYRSSNAHACLAIDLCCQKCFRKELTWKQHHYYTPSFFFACRFYFPFFNRSHVSGLFILFILYFNALFVCLFIQLLLVVMAASSHLMLCGSPDCSRSY